MSDPKDPEREDGPAAAPMSDAPAADLGADLGGETEVDEDFDDDLDIDAAVAQATADRPFTQEEAGLRTRVGWGRSPIVAGAVIIIGLFLLVKTWSDFVYFLRVFQGEPRDLGRVTDIYDAGEFSESFDNEWVHIEGDPDVQHAARMQSREGWIGFMRLIESDAAVLVAVPRETQTANNEFPGEFTGRMRRLDATPHWEKLQIFFTAEGIIDTIDLQPASVIESVAAEPGQAIAAKTTSDGEATVGPGEQVRIVARRSYGIAQLGRDTWKTQADAEAAIAATGLPWAFMEKRAMVWAFAVEVGPDAEVEVFQRLTRALNGGDDLVGADPKKGALVLPRRTTYIVDAGDLQLTPKGLTFSYGNNQAETGWQVSGEGSAATLVANELDKGRLAVPVAEIEGIRLERALEINPKGYLISSDQHPKDTWPSAVMFIAVLGVVGLNGWALVANLRRREDNEPTAA
ncbi:hypothetical protein PPSIR1_32128 [Plesiocystis pacifica SIR-1]|uniref:Uncharacterized protein n=1 Tax=Plesiocystis pacifica SIR-1 TaxID=391625 RepID=A6G2Z3_9BACT|nr:hypothetical protein [Plesiocystis pacifica]EDM79843.1 hypothetical protein PPSIR1_32128 [Plesiocystis pacifica SIR-1]